MTTVQGEMLPEDCVALADGQPVTQRVSIREDREELWPNVSGVQNRGTEGVVDGELLRDISVLVVDDCALYREYLQNVVSAHGATSAVAWDLTSLMCALAGTPPRIVLITMTTQDSDLLLRRTRALVPQARVVVTGVADDDESRIVACAESGVAGFHLRSESLTALLNLIERVADGETRCSSIVSTILLRALSAPATQQSGSTSDLVLTDRESEILSMLELGLSNRDIADQLHIAVHTVKNHVHSLLSKLGVGNRAQAAAVARSTRTQRQ